VDGESVEPPASPQPDAEGVARKALASRLAAAKSYKQQQQQLGQSYIVAAAATPETVSAATGVRPEMQSRALESARPEVEFITRDKGGYSPKTTSWGVFPRPGNISEAFGGGRNLQPGAPLESPEEAAERTAKVKAALAALRAAQGLDVDEADAGRIASLLAEADAAFNGGRLERAAESYRAAAALAPFRSEQGGEARLQLALCLDSLAEPRGVEEAKDLYNSLARHPTAAVSKRAKRLLWGMTDAAAFLKAETIDYTAAAGIREKYKTYLESQVTLLDVYTERRDEASQAEAAALNRVAAGALLALAALPTGLLLGMRQLADSHRG
jgi:hypothetical protein